MNSSEMDPAKQLGGGQAACCIEQLTGSEMKLLERLQDEERKRFMALGCSVFFGPFLLWMYWDAPLAYLELGKSDFYEARFIVPWLGGIVVVVYGIYNCFFNRSRKLLLKLATKYNQNYNAEQVAPSDGDKPSN